MPMAAFRICGGHHQPINVHELKTNVPFHLGLILFYSCKIRGLIKIVQYGLMSFNDHPVWSVQMNFTPNNHDTLVVYCHPFCPFLSSVFLFYLCVHQHFRGRKNRCYRLAVQRAFVYATKARKIK